MATIIDKTRHVPRLGLSRAEVAIAIGVCGNTVDQMVEEGFLPPPRRWHTRKVWLLSDLQAAMQAWPEDGGAQNKDAGGDDWSMSA